MKNMYRFREDKKSEIKFLWQEKFERVDEMENQPKTVEKNKDNIIEIKKSLASAKDYRTAGDKELVLSGIKADELLKDLNETDNKGLRNELAGKNEALEKAALEKVGLNDYFIRALESQGIMVNVLESNGEKIAVINTSLVYHGVNNQDGTFKSEKINSLDLKGKFIQSIGRNSNGTTTFDLIDLVSGDKIQERFSVLKFKDINSTKNEEENRWDIEIAARKAKRLREEFNYMQDNINISKLVLQEKDITPSEIKQALLQKIGLNNYVVEKLKDQGIKVNLIEKNGGNKIVIDTSKVYHQIKNADGTIFNEKVESLLLEGKYISGVVRNSDGTTIFELVHLSTGERTNEKFLKK